MSSEFHIYCLMASEFSYVLSYGKYHFEKFYNLCFHGSGKKKKHSLNFSNCSVFCNKNNTLSSIFDAIFNMYFVLNNNHSHLIKSQLRFVAHISSY